MNKRLLAILFLLLSLASPLMAQVDLQKLPADSSWVKPVPTLEAVIQGYVVWGAAVLFSLLVLIMAFKAPKRTYYDPKA